MHENKIEISLARLSVLVLIIGVATGYGAVAFRGLIGLIHNLAFLGIWSVNYDANVFRGQVIFLAISPMTILQNPLPTSFDYRTRLDL